MVRAKLKRPPCKGNNNNNKNSNRSNNDSHNDSNVSDKSQQNNNNSNNIAELANIRHNIDIGLKVSTRKCGNRSCPLHSRLKCTNQARSKISNRAYITRGLANCNTKHLVYMIQCKKCGKQYVGQTGQSLRERFEKHIKYDKPGTNTMHDHFRGGSCSGTHNITVQTLHVLDEGLHGLTREQTETELKRIELLWIDTLLSEYPHAGSQLHQK